MLPQPCEPPFLMGSNEGLDKSTLGRWTLLELDLLRPFRMSLGSMTLNPLAFANRTSTSVRLTTPTKRPLMFAPGKELADTDGPVGVMKGV